MVNIPNATAYLLAEHLGDFSTAALTSCTFSSVLMYLRPSSFLVLSVLPVSSNYLNHIHKYLHQVLRFVQTIMTTKMGLTTDCK